jgi:hypothetical protein
LLTRLADLAVGPKQVERLTERIGRERVAGRDAATAAFAALPLAEKFAAPPGVTPPGLAVVMADGGRLQLLDRAAAGVAATHPTAPGAAAAARPPGEPDWDEEVPPHKGHWREDKVGLLLSMASAVRATDPCPDIPAAFLDVLRIPKLARQLKKNARADEDAVEEPADAAGGEDGLQAEAVYEAPQGVTRRVVASRARWPEFAPQLAAAAWGLGFQGAARKAFVGDGSSNNGTLQRRFFGSFVPILDFIQALSYLFAAAQAGRNFATGWGYYQEWITWVWQGQVRVVIAALEGRQAELGVPGADDAATSPATVVSKTLIYQTLEEWLRLQGVSYTIQVVRKAEGTPGFVPVKIRWVVERAIAWLGRCRRLSKDYEDNTASSETWVKIAAIQQMARRLRPNTHKRQPAFKYPKKDKKVA